MHRPPRVARIALMHCALVPLLSAALAAQVPTSAPRPTAPTGPFAGMTLAPSQRTQIQSLTAQTQRDLRATLGAGPRGRGPDSTARATVLRIVTAHNEAVRHVLSPAQRVQMDANHRSLNDSRRTTPLAADTAGGR